jgi:hypothetical protein
VSALPVSTLQRMNGYLLEEKGYAIPLIDLDGANTIIHIDWRRMVLDAGIGEPPYGVLGSFGEMDFSRRIRAAVDGDLTLFFNVSDKPVHATVDYYFTAKHQELLDKDQSDFPEGSISWRLRKSLVELERTAANFDTAIEPGGFLFVPVEFEYYVSCVNPTPEEYTIEISPSATAEISPSSIAHLYHFSEEAQQKCPS